MEGRLMPVLLISSAVGLTLVISPAQKESVLASDARNGLELALLPVRLCPESHQLKLRFRLRNVSLTPLRIPNPNHPIGEGKLIVIVTDGCKKFRWRNRPTISPKLEYPQFILLAPWKAYIWSVSMTLPKWVIGSSLTRYKVRVTYMYGYDLPDIGPYEPVWAGLLFVDWISTQ